MMFTKHTQSEDHNVVSGQEKDTIERHTSDAGQQRVSKLSETEQAIMLKELEAFKNKNR